MTDTMAKYQKITDYQAKYLDVSKGIIDVLEKNVNGKIKYTLFSQ